MDRRFLGRVALTGCLTAAVALMAFGYELRLDGNLTDARNAGFSVLVVAELLRSFGARSEAKTIWEVGLFSKLRLLAIVAVSLGLQLVIHHTPRAQGDIRHGADIADAVPCLDQAGIGAARRSGAGENHAPEDGLCRVDWSPGPHDGANGVTLRGALAVAVPRG